MRTDFPKILCERPRRGGGPSKGRLKATKDPEDLPAKESMKSQHRDRRSLNENLSPLMRFLDSRVGRPWDDVYSEACKVIKPNSTVKNHVKVHLLQMVEQHTFLGDDGKAYYVPEFYLGRDSKFGAVCLEETRSRMNQFYVCPVTRNLLKSKRIPELDWNKREVEKQAKVLRVITDTTEIRKIEGIWYHITVLPEWPKQKGPVLLKDALGNTTREGSRFVKTKRQLSSKELKKFGIKNGL